MANKLLMIKVAGNDRTYWFDFYGDPKHLEGWRADGLEINEVCNVIPELVVQIGLLRPWLFLQDLFNFRNPLGRG